MAQDPFAQVTRSIDGDTVEISHHKKPIRIRFYGIDAPRKGQRFGLRAKGFLINLVGEKESEVLKKSKYRY